MTFTRKPGSRRPGQTSCREDHHIVRNARLQPTASSAAIHAQLVPSLGAPVSSRTIRRHLTEGQLGSCAHYVVYSDETRVNLSSDDKRVHVWRPRSDRLNPAFALQRPTSPTAGVMAWGAIAYNTRSPLVLIRGTMTAQWYVHDILQPHVLSLMQRL
ncbi:transposable element Tcb2 transposase [Trichonephila clavipes]|uniref:Transposable element Tcb2 transposase n=1 Tax=Trichonephila clavipes TaxID=2585209 RepID=A0A8X6RNH7_TRICX|nr:transposable element Tcb2 transposase [Trichonephila clavipes]GFX98756.1 transposable element Tcb2 transposase [Trichonephila clavipes]